MSVKQSLGSRARTFFPLKDPMHYFIISSDHSIEH